MSDFFARLRIAWRFKEWPWRVPADVVRYRIGLVRPTAEDLRHAKEIADMHGLDYPPEER